MAQLEIIGKGGKSVGKHELNATIAAAEPAMSVIHRAVVTEEANKRQGTQSAKTRSETRGGGRKPYKQKKTGNARQGTIRAPHYAHGGMAFAVKPRDYTKKINKKERRAAILGALHAQITAGNVIIVDKIMFTEPKTKEAMVWLESLGLATARRVMVVVPEFDDTAYRSFRNIPAVTVRTAPAVPEPVKVEAKKATTKAERMAKRTYVKKVAPAATKTNTFSTRDLLVAHKIVIAQDALKRIEEVWAK